MLLLSSASPLSMAEHLLEQLVVAIACCEVSIVIVSAIAGQEAALPPPASPLMISRDVNRDVNMINWDAEMISLDAGMISRDAKMTSRDFDMID
ncbi:Major facilitator superfamily MFS_1 [Sesbania bispinosa]|nr:Major facilitator superfamily MFS_1 [Sesbania bispinosa]